MFHTEIIYVVLISDNIGEIYRDVYTDYLKQIWYNHALVGGVFVLSEVVFLNFSEK